MRIERRTPRMVVIGTVLLLLLGLGWTAATAVVVAPTTLASAVGLGLSDKGGPKDDKGGPKDDDDDDDDPGDDDGNNTKGNLRLATNSLPSLIAGQEGWVSLLWYAETDVCDIQVTARSPGVTITYPTSTGSFSSLYTNDALAETNLDYTAFKVTAPPTAGNRTIELEATFTRLKDSGALKKSDNLVLEDVANCSGNSGKVKQTVPLRVTAPTGAAVTLEASSVELRSGAPSWVPISFMGNAPNLDNFRVTVTAPKDFEVVYPGDGTSSGLNKDARLPVGVSDSAAVRLDPLEAEPGTYRVPVEATWTGGSWTGTIQVTVTR